MTGQKNHFTVKTVKELLGRAGGWWVMDTASLSSIIKTTTFVQLRIHFVSYFVVVVLELDEGYRLSFYPCSNFFLGSDILKFTLDSICYY